ncbi:MAG: hypothetical protein IPK82_11225 [Polyangiaceae bacterium]|nr:hypothetical protein [Polyangiaceae bacterium]
MMSIIRLVHLHPKGNWKVAKALLQPTTTLPTTHRNSVRTGQRKRNAT